LRFDALGEQSFGRRDLFGQTNRMCSIIAMMLHMKVLP
jgi:hypothetical protein